MSRRKSSPEPETKPFRFRFEYTQHPSEKLPNEIFPSEDLAIKSFLENQTPPIDFLNSLLINPYTETESFRSDNFIPELPGLVTERFLPRTPEEYMINDPGDFQENIKKLIPDIDWSNIIAAGGSILRCLTVSNKEPTYISSDVDLFIYGLSPEDAYRKILQIVNHFKDNNGIILFRTKRAITIVTDKHIIQIILRVYVHPAEVLLGFDLPCVRVCYDGNNVWMLRSARNAIINRYNLATGYQPFRTGTYESRLIKYYRRGYAIRVLNFDPSRVDQNIYTAKEADLEGLSKLLYMLKFKCTRLFSFDDYDRLRNFYSFLESLAGNPNTIPSLSENTSILSNIYNNFDQFKSTLKFALAPILNTYLKNPDFVIGVLPENWDAVFSPEWDPVQGFWPVISGRYAIEEMDEEDILPPTTLGPVEFIGSLSEYLNSLLKPAAWYCQAYNIPMNDCL